MQTMETRRWRLKGPEMEGPIARWYARVRGSKSQIEGYRKQAAQLTAGLPDGAKVLEVAAWSRLPVHRNGSASSLRCDSPRHQPHVRRDRQRQREAGRSQRRFEQGDVAKLPFKADSFDLVVCQAAFKNFTLPRTALAEMYRVLRIGGTAVIQDMSHGATHADIEEEVKGMDLGRLSSFMTKATLERLRNRAYSPLQFELLVAESPFQTCEITTAGIGLEVRLTKHGANGDNHDS